MISDILIASGLVIIENNKVLLVRHGDTEKEQVIWKFIGGKVNTEDCRAQKDILEQTCKREAKEEMGIKINIIMPLKPMLISKPGESTKLVMLIHYLAKRIGKIKHGKDIVEWAWHDVNDLPNTCAPDIKPVLKSFFELANNYKYLLFLN